MTGGTWNKNPLIPQIGSRNNFIINGLASREKKEKKNILLNLQKEIITVLLVMIFFLHVERNREMMTISRGFRKIKAPTYEGEMNIGEKVEEILLGMRKYL